MYKCNTIIIAVYLIFTQTLTANAGTGHGLIHGIIAIRGIITFTLETHENGPVCHTVTNDFAFDSTTPEGKSKYALLLIALTAKKAIGVEGTGNCSAWGDRETAEKIILY
ncbi:hypothetical protein EV217_1934 [Phyllobacterium myrsinacearum]|uniref:hypothetical protein n=1 Tax=Phyllobacterium myrsinacearum TaxID=28101 RepID=UPI001028DADF|nr:hypothetical protein [Phyllobacterium myrsinacearum]RZS83194.1 hypothetical protein EV217_1934 [Phyllobacterium myrsinacearum]